MFADRKQAGKLLAAVVLELLEPNRNWKNAGCVVVGLPRGGVPVALEVALSLGAPLDILVSKKIHAPDNTELAIGAVTSSGLVVLDDRIMRALGYPQSYADAQALQKDELTRQTKLAEAHWVEAGEMLQRPALTGKWVVLVDDGIATGMTTLAALRTLQSAYPYKLILAVPVVPEDTYLRLKSECDYLISLAIPSEFSSVGQFYRDFHQVGDAEVIEALRKANSPVLKY